MYNNAAEPTYEIREHFGVLGEKGTGWTKEVNLVAWNGNQAKIDVREWDSTHEKMTRGMTFDTEEAEAIQRILKNNLPSKKDFPTETSGPSPDGEIAFKIIKHLGVISVTHHNGWSKEVNIVSWNDMPPKVEIRSWSPDHERMTRGVSFEREEAKAFAALDLTIHSNDDAPAKKQEEPDVKDTVIDMLIEHFTEVPEVKLELNEYKEVKVESREGEDTILLHIGGKSCKLSVREVTP